MAKVWCNPQLTVEPLRPLVQGLVAFEQSYRQYYMPMIGNYGRFEENPRAMLAGIHKLHIAVSETDFDKWKTRTGQNRKSDNYLVYAKHDFEQDTFLILDFISPEAHKRIRSKLADLVLLAEDFQDTYPERFHEKFTAILL